MDARAVAAGGPPSAGGFDTRPAASIGDSAIDNTAIDDTARRPVEATLVELAGAGWRLALSSWRAKR